MRPAWGCHTCGRIDRAPFLWLARRRSIRHEHEAHGSSAYDQTSALPPPWVFLLFWALYIGTAFAVHRWVVR